ncbi:hypothetical protein U0070_026089 [Myodes glareolus]|uniref:Uncharacterized protein n=1 Tax=Myodes glareolus TaxID=447135 RepID=A0AAW0HXJ7_MYOGA
MTFREEVQPFLLSRKWVRDLPHQELVSPWVSSTAKPGSTPNSAAEVTLLAVQAVHEHGGAVLDTRSPC